MCEDDAIKSKTGMSSVQTQKEPGKEGCDRLQREEVGWVARRVDER